MRENELIEEKFSIIGKMAAGITHEINTPLTYIRGNIELMAKEIDRLDDSTESKKYLKEDIAIVLEGISRIAEIVDSMREMSSQSNEKMKKINIYNSIMTALTLSHNKSKQISKIILKGKVFNLGRKKNRFEYLTTAQKQRINQVWVIIINNALDVLKLKKDFDSRLLDIEINEDNKYIKVTFKDNGG